MALINLIYPRTSTFPTFSPPLYYIWKKNILTEANYLWNILFHFPNFFVCPYSSQLIPLSSYDIMNSLHVSFMLIFGQSLWLGVNGITIHWGNPKVSFRFKEKKDIFLLIHISFRGNLLASHPTSLLPTNLSSFLAFQFLVIGFFLSRLF